MHARASASAASILGTCRLWTVLGFDCFSAQVISLNPWTEPCVSAGAVGKALPFGPQTAEHCILASGLQPSRKPAAQPLNEPEIEGLLGHISSWEAWLRGCETSVPAGFIYSKGVPACLPACLGGPCLAYMLQAGVVSVRLRGRLAVSRDSSRCCAALWSARYWSWRVGMTPWHGLLQHTFCQAYHACLLRPCTALTIQCKSLCTVCRIAVLSMSGPRAVLHYRVRIPDEIPAKEFTGQQAAAGAQVSSSQPCTMKLCYSVKH